MGEIFKAVKESTISNNTDLVNLRVTLASKVRKALIGLSHLFQLSHMSQLSQLFQLSHMSQLSQPLNSQAVTAVSTVLKELRYLLKAT